MKLQAIRTAAGLTQAQLAKAAKVDQKYISQLENGQISEPSHQKVIRICRVLGVDPQDVDEFKVNSR